MRQTPTPQERGAREQGRTHSVRRLPKRKILVSIIMVSLLPYRQISVSTDLAMEGAVSRLSAITTEQNVSAWSLPPSGKKYAGQVSPQGFNIKRIIGYTNSFLPVLDGKFIATDEGTRLDIHMALHPLVKLFLVFWSTPLLLAFLYLAYQGISNGMSFSQVTLWPLGMVAVAYLIIYTIFWVESLEDQRLITGLFSN